MSIEQLESRLMELPREDRQRFAEWFYHNENEILGSDEQSLSTSACAEIIRRRDELMQNPGLGVPVTEEWFNSLKERLARARADQASAS